MSPPKRAPGWKEKNRAPSTPPPFTLNDIKSKIPAHCFERSTLRSSYYLLLDVIAVGTLYYLSQWISIFPTYIAFFLWPIYWILQGGVGTGLWVVAHECGHRAFSDSVLICDVVGFIFHSVLLVPYHSWRISHAKHHRSTGDVDRDETFIPHKASKLLKKKGYLPPPEEDFAFALFFELVRMFTFGWPVYLATHVTGRDYGRQTNHYLPSSPLFNEKQFYQVVISDLGLVAVLTLLTIWGYYTSFLNVFFLYVVPYMITNFWLLLYTYLHHTDLRLPHYPSDKWNWFQGALSTIDRDYGAFWNALHHNIGSTHVLHHLFSKIPHYHAVEATNAIIPVLGEYYQFTNEPILTSLWRTRKYCRYVDDAPHNQVLWYK